MSDNNNNDCESRCEELALRVNKLQQQLDLANNKISHFEKLDKVGNVYEFTENISEVYNTSSLDFFKHMLSRYFDESDLHDRFDTLNTKPKLTNNIVHDALSNWRAQLKRNIGRSVSTVYRKIYKKRSERSRNKAGEHRHWYSMEMLDHPNMGCWLTDFSNLFYKFILITELLVATRLNNDNKQYDGYLKHRPIGLTKLGRKDNCPFVLPDQEVIHELDCNSVDGKIYFQYGPM